jgi:hypothetical protein
MSRWVSNIDSNYNWYVSGTPFVNYTGVKNCAKFIGLKLEDMNRNFVYDFTNNTGYTHVNESQDMYYQVDIDKVAHTYSIFKYTTQKSSNRFGVVSGSTITPITFYQKRS